MKSLLFEEVGRIKSGTLNTNKFCVICDTPVCISSVDFLLCFVGFWGFFYFLRVVESKLRGGGGHVLFFLLCPVSTFWRSVIAEFHSDLGPVGCVHGCLKDTWL